MKRFEDYDYLSDTNEIEILLDEVEVLVNKTLKDKCDIDEPWNADGSKNTLIIMLTLAFLAFVALCLYVKI